jgi:hypothetical protein
VTPEERLIADLREYVKQYRAETAHRPCSSAFIASGFPAAIDELETVLKEMDE